MVDSVVSARSARPGGGRRCDGDGGQCVAGFVALRPGGAHDAPLYDPTPS